MKHVIVIAVFALLTAGCSALNSYGFRSDPFTSADDRSVVIYVENTTTQDVRVVARGAGSRHELGTMNANSSRQVSIAWDVYQELRFQVDPVSGRQISVRGVSVGPGERVNFVIVQPLERSFVRR